MKFPKWEACAASIFRVVVNFHSPEGWSTRFFQNVGTIYQTTQSHFQKCQYHLPNNTRPLSKISVPSTKQHKDTFQNVGTIYQTTQCHIPKYWHHLPNYTAIYQNICAIYQTTEYPKIFVPPTKLQHYIPRQWYHLPNWCYNQNIGVPLIKLQCYIPKYRYHKLTTVLYPKILVPNTKLNGARPQHAGTDLPNYTRPYPKTPQFCDAWDSLTLLLLLLFLNKKN